MLEIQPVLRLFHRSFSINKIGVLGIPFCKGQKKNGVDHGPQVIREHGLVKKLKYLLPDSEIKDYGDVSYTISPEGYHFDKHLNNYNHVVSCAKEISKHVQNIIEDGYLCINLGGDHSVGLGTVDGHSKAKKGEVAVIWIDAHADINTLTTSGTKSMHGMPVSLLTKELESYWPKTNELQWIGPRISLDNFAYIGLRSVDAYERYFLEKFNVAAFTMGHVEHIGLDKVIEMALDKVDKHRTKSIHVSFDIDSLDVSEAPSTGTPVRGGLSLREGLYLLECLHRTGRVNCIDMVEVNPTIGSEADKLATVEAAVELILTACGQNRLGLKINVDDESIRQLNINDIKSY